MKCECGADVGTRFCPDCGKAGVGTLERLLAYCQHHAKEAERCLAISKKRLKNPLRDGNEWQVARQKRQRETSIKRRTNTLSKWQGWADALREVLDA